jgi:SAM-dependent methyltransferase
MKSEDSMFTAAIESAHIFNNAVREVAVTSGLLTALGQYRSVGDVVRVMDFLPERLAQAQHLLRMLAAEGLLDEREHGGVQVFRTNKAAVRAELAAPDNGRYRPKDDQISSWFGDGHVERIRAANKTLLGPDLGFLRSPTAAIRFNRDYEQAWRINLQNPLYEFGRLICVRELVSRGNRFVDLACGPGFGAARLAEFCTQPAVILGVDKSRDFLDIARRTIYPNAQVRFVERDLNTGLPPIPPGSVDGVLFNGAFHFMADKAARLGEIHRALRVGGLLALGHCFSHSGFADERMHDFYFSLLEDRAHVLPWAQVKQLVEAAGFQVFREFHRGSHSYLLAERLPDPVAPGRPSGAVAGGR